jgi:hypothetical protein
MNSNIEIVSAKRLIRTLSGFVAVIVTGLLTACSGGKSTPQPTAPVSPTLTIAVTPTTISVGQSATVTWSSANVTSCTASGAWDGPESLNGSQNVTPGAAGTDVYTLACSGAGGSASGSASLTVNTAISISSVSSSSPTPLTPIYIGTVGINASAPLVIQFSDESGFSVSEAPIRVTPDSTVVAAVPLYFSGGGAQITSGNVKVVLTQGGQSTAAVALAIQDLPHISSYGTQLGDISEAFMDFQEMEIARRINELQAYQALPGNTANTSQAQTTLQAFLNAFIQSRGDVDQVYANNSAVINAATLPDGTPVRFDQTSLDMMDRVIGVYLNEIAPIVMSSVPAARRSRKSAPIVSPFRLAGRGQFGVRPQRKNAAWAPFQESGWTWRAVDRKSRRAISAANPSNVQSAITVLKAAANLTGLASTCASYQEANSTADGPSLLDYGLAVGGGIAGFLGLADTAGKALVPSVVNPALGGLLASVSLLQHLGYELGDLAFIMVASRYGGDPGVLADAQKDLNKNALESVTDTVAVELSLLDPEGPLAGFGPDLITYFENNAGTVVLQSATLLNNVVATAIAIHDTSDDPVTDATLNAAAETTSVFGSDTQGFAEGVGTVDVSYSGGPVAPLTGIQLSSDLTDIFTTVTDPTGNYDFFFPLQDPAFDYANTTVTIMDPLSQTVLASEVIDLTGLNTNSSVQIPTVQGTCTDDDGGAPDGDDPDCD